jgi:hypothetical protein
VRKTSVRQRVASLFAQRFADHLNVGVDDVLLTPHVRAV